MSVPVTMPKWTTLTSHEPLDSLLPELFLQPVIPFIPNVDADDDDSPARVAPAEHEAIHPPQSKSIRRVIIHSVPSYEGNEPLIHIRNPLVLYYLEQNKPHMKKLPRNRLADALQLEHCKGRGCTVRGGLLVMELSSNQSSEFVNLSYEHIKYVELVIALYLRYGALME
ncbi:hypothetical protein JVT61DRAFT_3255 [Boletus reticuloceps]|uniref:Uncharacterized protein n=1 Tax=Boletus reticuloceps TaxID=495285 RepID=A0A8I2YRW6_9AGAM|nr:hypothetical protein JVT61DRAFT_3255 [Boletus reticuloceps]